MYRAFIVMPFDDELEGVYERIESSLMKYGFDAK